MTNPLKPTSGTSGFCRPEAYVPVNDVMVACTWDEFIGWMNTKNKRAGAWVTKYLLDENGKVMGRTIDWADQVGTDSYRSQAGQRAARAAPIQRYVTDYGRVPA